MADYHAGYLVTLAEDIRSADAVAVINALRMVRGVVSVEPVTSEFAQHAAAYRRDNLWRKRIIAMLDRASLNPDAPA